MSEKNSLLRFRLQRTLEALASKEGRHTELVSLYVPRERQISEVMNNLRQEYSTASNIKSKTTRKNVVDAIEKTMQRLKLFREPPLNGLAIFCGAIPQNGIGSEKIETYVIEPPEKISIYFYRCDQRFHIEYLEEMLKEKDSYGIVLIDGNDASIATLRGRDLRIVKELTSGLPGKHRAGGQSSRRFERLREAEVNDWFKRVGNHVNEIFLPMSDLKGVIIGGPGPTKEDFGNGEYLQYTLKNRILAVVDTAYVGEQGVKEVIEKSPEIFKEVRYYEEKKIMQSFLYELGHDTGLVTYGENEVRRALDRGIVRTLLLSEEFDETMATIKCSNCGYSEKRTIRGSTPQIVEQELAGKACPNCSFPNLEVIEARDIIDELAEIAIKTGANVELISKQTEEGVSLKESFAGFAAVLRYKQ